MFYGKRGRSGLCSAKVAIVPSYNPRRGCYTLVIAKYWRCGDEVAKAVDEFVNTKFRGREVVGHPGARSVTLVGEGELGAIPSIAKELSTYLTTQSRHVEVETSTN